jgi:hypothetical protein
MVNMKQKKLSKDRTSVAVGPGNRWKEVYDFLTPYSLAVVGGRVSFDICLRTSELIADAR